MTALDLIIKPNAIVCESAKFILQSSSCHNILETNTLDDTTTNTANTNTNTNTATNSTDATDTSKIKLIIEHGNVFHPNSCLEIIPPALVGPKEISVVIGPNNLFEEKSHIIFDLSRISEEQMDGHHSEGLGDLLLIGSYNLFSASSRVVHCQSIGNANIIGPKCHILVECIENGNLFQAGSFVDNHSDDWKDSCQEKVFYWLDRDMGISSSGGSSSRSNGHSTDSSSRQRHGMCKVRNHNDGVKKNISEVSMLLRANRKILTRHHRILAVMAEEETA